MKKSDFKIPDGMRKTTCVAFGCPCLGTMNTSTGGGGQWLCGFHFGHDAGDWQAITVELNRYRWLQELIVNLRQAYSQEREVWAAVAVAAKNTMAANMRNDLLPSKEEIGSVWIGRLDQALTDACKPSKSTQESLAFAAMEHA